MIPFRLVTVALVAALVGCSAGPRVSVNVPKTISVEQGGTAETGIRIIPTGGFAETFQFSVDPASKSLLPAGLSLSFTPEANKVFSTLKIAATAAVEAGDYPVKLQLNSTSVSRIEETTIRVLAPPFTVQSLDIIALERGAAVTTEVKIARRPGFGGDVQLALQTQSGQPVPSGIGVSFTPASMAGAISSTSMRIQTDGTVAIGDYALRVRAASGNSVQVEDFTLRVNTPPNPDFNLALSGSALSMTALGSQQTTVTVNRVGGFDSSVGLSITRADGSPLPAGLSAVFTPTSLTSQNVSSTLQFTTASGIQNGTYNLLVKATAGTTEKTLPLTLTINITPTFTVGLGTGQQRLTIRQGRSDTVSVVLGSIAGFSGEVALALNRAGSQTPSLPAGITAAFAPTAPNLTSAQATSVLTVSVSRDVNPGIYSLQVEGRTGSDLAQAPKVAVFELEVRPEVDPTFTLLVPPTPPGIVDIRENRFQFSVSVARYGGFADPITIELVDPPASFENLNISDTSITTTESTSTISFTPKQKGKFDIRVRATSGSLVREGTVGITVHDFNLGSVGSRDLTLAPGGTGSVQITRDTAEFPYDINLTLQVKQANGQFVDISQVSSIITSATFSPSNTLVGGPPIPVHTLTITVAPGAAPTVLDLRVVGTATGPAGEQTRPHDFKLNITAP